MLNTSYDVSYVETRPVIISEVTLKAKLRGLRYLLMVEKERIELHLNDIGYQFSHTFLTHSFVCSNSYNHILKSTSIYTFYVYMTKK